MIYKFYKTEDQEWFVDLPGYPGCKEDLQMVMGADSMLDIYAGGAEVVHLDIEVDDSTIDVAEYDTLVKTEEELEAGANYLINSLMNKRILATFHIWLCDVTEFVFGEFPDYLFIKKIK